MLEDKGPIEILSPRKRDRELVLSKLIERSLVNGFCVCLITKTSLHDAASLQIRKEGKDRLYFVSKTVDIKTFVNLMLKTRYWHKSSFTIIIGATGLAENLSREHISLDTSLPELRQQLITEIYGYIFPIDDELLVYGREPINRIVEGLNIAETK